MESGVHSRLKNSTEKMFTESRKSSATTTVLEIKGAPWVHILAAGCLGFSSSFFTLIQGAHKGIITSYNVLFSFLHL